MTYPHTTMPVPDLLDGPYTMRPDISGTYLYMTGETAESDSQVTVYQIRTSDNTLHNSLLLTDSGGNTISMITIPFSDTSRVFVIAESTIGKGWRVFTIDPSDMTLSSTSGLISTPFFTGTGLHPAITCNETGEWISGLVQDDTISGSQIFLLNTSSGFIFNDFVTSFGIPHLDTTGITGFVIIGDTMYLVGFTSGKMYKCTLADGNPPVITLTDSFTPGAADYIDAITYRQADNQIIIWYRGGDVIVWDALTDTVSATYTKTVTSFSDQMPINLEDKNSWTNRDLFLNVLTDGSTYDTFNSFNITDGSNTEYPLTLWQSDPFGGPGAEQRKVGSWYDTGNSAIWVSNFDQSGTPEKAMVFYFPSVSPRASVRWI